MIKEREMQEFQIWLDNCIKDAELKLGLTKEEIVLVLLKKVEQVFLWYFILSIKKED